MSPASSSPTVRRGSGRWCARTPTPAPSTTSSRRCTRFYGDVFDAATVREAMDGVDDVYYCVVDTRAWLRDPSPLFRTNVEGLRNVLDVAVKQPDLRRFIFTSTYATVGRRHGHVATEDDVIGSRGLTPYVQSRVQAENLVMRYVADAGSARRRDVRVNDLRQRGLGRHPARRLHRRRGLRQAALLMNGIQLEVVGVDDAARAMILAAEHGRIGERYLVSERMIALNDVVRIAADEAGVPPPQRVDFGPDALCPGCAGQPEGPAHRQGRRTQPRVGAHDARRSRRGQQQGEARVGLAATPGRGIDPRGRPVLGRDAHPSKRTVRPRNPNRPGPNGPDTRRSERAAADDAGDAVRQSAGRRRSPLDPARPLRQGRRGTHRLRLGRQRLSTRGRAPSVAVRSAHFDNWARQFLAVHDEAVVLHAGCGLDARVYRLDPRSGRAVVRRRLPRSHRAARTDISRPHELPNAAGLGDRSVLAGRDTGRPSRAVPRRGPDDVPDERRRAGAASSRRRIDSRRANCSSTRSTPSAFGRR